MAFHLLKRLTLLFVLLGLSLANKGVVPLEVMAVSMHGEQGDRWIYHDNSSITNTMNNVTTAPSTSFVNTLSPKLERRRFKAELTNLVMQEPGFVLLSLSVVFISGGMVFL